MKRPVWAPPEIDVAVPSAARVYDYYLGGSHNFEADRKMAREAVRMWPDLPIIMRENRAFLQRAVEYLAREGITQFLDIGSGIPTAGNVHEVAHVVNPEIRVVYVDRDPVAVAHSRALLGSEPRTRVVHADLRQPETILQDPTVEELLDFTAPVAVLLVAVLHFVTDADNPAEAVSRLCQPLQPGSFLALSHATSDVPGDVAASHQEMYRQTPTPMTMRTRAEIQHLFPPTFPLLPPGLVRLPEWRPDEDEHSGVDPSRVAGFAGVGLRT